MKKYTMIGYLGLFCWSMAPVLNASVKSIPIFQILFIALGISFIASSIILTKNNKWTTLKQPGFMWLVGILGIYGNDVCYIAASKYAPVFQVGLINYLWPLFVVIFSSILPKETIKIKYIFAAIIGFCGIYMLLIIGNDDGHGFKVEYLYGYVFAFLGAIIWSIFVLLSRLYKNSPPEIIGMYCGIGAFFSVLIHLKYEIFVMPNFTEGATLLFMGLLTQGIAYMMWDTGIKKGNFRLLTILSYGNPIIAVMLLFLFGYVFLSSTLLISCILITFSGLIAGVNWRLIFIRIGDLILKNYSKKVNVLLSSSNT